MDIESKYFMIDSLLAKKVYLNRTDFTVLL